MSHVARGNASCYILIYISLDRFATQISYWRLDAHVNESGYACQWVMLNYYSPRWCLSESGVMANILMSHGIHGDESCYFLMFSNLDRFTVQVSPCVMSHGTHDIFRCVAWLRSRAHSQTMEDWSCGLLSRARRSLLLSLSLSLVRALSLALSHTQTHFLSLAWPPLPCPTVFLAIAFSLPRASALSIWRARANGRAFSLYCAVRARSLSRSLSCGLLSCARRFLTHACSLSLALRAVFKWAGQTRTKIGEHV